MISVLPLSCVDLHVQVWHRARPLEAQWHQHQGLQDPSLRWEAGHRLRHQVAPVTASFRDRLSFLFMLWPDVWAATNLKEPGGDPVRWGWCWLCRGVHWCLHWQGEGCCSLEGIGAAWSSYGCYRMFVLRLFVMFMFSLVSECMHLGDKLTDGTLSLA